MINSVGMASEVVGAVSQGSQEIGTSGSGLVGEIEVSGLLQTWQFADKWCSVKSC